MVKLDLVTDASTRDLAEVASLRRAVWTDEGVAQLHGETSFLDRWDPIAVHVWYRTAHGALAAATRAYCAKHLTECRDARHFEHLPVAGPVVNSDNTVVRRDCRTLGLAQELLKATLAIARDHEAEVVIGVIHPALTNVVRALGFVNFGPSVPSGRFAGRVIQPVVHWLEERE